MNLSFMVTNSYLFGRNIMGRYTKNISIGFWNKKGGGFLSTTVGWKIINQIEAVSEKLKINWLALLFVPRMQRI